MGVTMMLPSVGEYKETRRRRKKKKRLRGSSKRHRGSPTYEGTREDATRRSPW